MGKIEPEKEIKKVVICYEDGEEKEIEKGFFCEMHPEEECLNLTFHMFCVEGKRTGMHHRGDDGVGRPSGNVLTNKRNTGRRRGKP